MEISVDLKTSGWFEYLHLRTVWGVGLNYLNLSFVMYCSFAQLSCAKVYPKFIGADSHIKKRVCVVCVAITWICCDGADCRNTEGLCRRNVGLNRGVPSIVRPMSRRCYCEAKLGSTMMLQVSEE